MYSNVKSSDAKFEVVTSVMAKKLVLERENDLVGHKRLIYVFDRHSEITEPTRKVIVDFFKKSLGFTDDQIILFERFEN